MYTILLAFAEICYLLKGGVKEGHRNMVSFVLTFIGIDFTFIWVVQECIAL